VLEYSVDGHEHINRFAPFSSAPRRRPFQRALEEGAEAVFATEV
jgi:hypothetical protein